MDFSIKKTTSTKNGVQEFSNLYKYFRFSSKTIFTVCFARLELKLPIIFHFYVAAVAPVINRFLFHLKGKEKNQ